VIPRALACVLALALARSGPQAPPAKRVLLVGNSLTLANGLGAMIEALGRAVGDPPIETRTVAAGGYSLEDHWKHGEARRAIATGTWSAVVLQQGPSSQADSQTLLREYTRRFDREARRAGAQVALFMVWPPRSGPGTYADVSRSYRRAAADVHGVLLPVGDAFAAASRLNAAAPLFGPDGFHPTSLGTCLAAIVIHQALTERAEPFVAPFLSPSGDEFPPVTLSPSMVVLFRAAATQAALHD
jgi:hypothetical protein